MTHMVDPAKLLDTLHIHATTLATLVQACLSPPIASPPTTDMRALKAAPSTRAQENAPAAPPPKPSVPALTVAPLAAGFGTEDGADGPAEEARPGLLSAQLLARVTVPADGVPAEGDLRLLAVAILAAEGAVMTSPTLADIVARELGLGLVQAQLVRTRMPNVLHRAQKDHGVVEVRQTAGGKRGYAATSAGEDWLLTEEPNPWADA